MTPARLAWLCAALGAAIGGALHGLDAPHVPALLAGTVAGAALGLGASVGAVVVGTSEEGEHGREQ